MKKALAMLCSLSLVLAMGTTAFAADADTNLALGMTGISSGDLPQGDDGSSRAASNALDGSTSTMWTAAQDTVTLNDSDKTFQNEVYLGVDFGMEVTFDQIEITFSVDRPAGDESGYKIQVSDDGETWTDAENANYQFAEFTAEWQKVADNTVDTITFSEPVTAQYVRVLLLKPCIDLKANQTIREFAVYDTTGEANPDFEGPVSSTASEPETSSEAASEEETSSTSATSSRTTTTSSRATAVTSSQAADSDGGNIVLPIVIGVIVAAVVVVVIVVIVKKNKK